MWITESYSIRQLSNLSGHSPFKLKQIKNYWLQRPPDTVDLNAPCSHLLFDGTYFHKKGCLIVMMDVSTKKTILNHYTDKESYQNVFPLLMHLKEQGLRPRFITMDGHLHVIRAMREVWPGISIQRCLYHIQSEGLRWLRTFPKTDAARALRIILLQLTSVKSFKERDDFLNAYNQWISQYKDFVLTLPNSSVAFKDLKRTMALINNAMPDMFHHLEDLNIPSTTNLLESFFSRLKSDFRRHRGLSDTHKIAYLKWYCYFKNQLN